MEPFASNLMTLALPLRMLRSRHPSVTSHDLSLPELLRVKYEVSRVVQKQDDNTSTGEVMQAVPVHLPTKHFGAIETLCSPIKAPSLMPCHALSCNLVDDGNEVKSMTSGDASSRFQTIPVMVRWIIPAALPTSKFRAYRYARAAQGGALYRPILV